MRLRLGRQYVILCRMQDDQPLACPVTGVAGPRIAENVTEPNPVDLSAVPSMVQSWAELHDKRLCETFRMHDPDAEACGAAAFARWSLQNTVPAGRDIHGNLIASLPEGSAVVPRFSKL